MSTSDIIFNLFRGVAAYTLSRHGVHIGRLKKMGGEKCIVTFSSLINISLIRRTSNFCMVIMWWKSRADALYTFKTSYPVVIHALKRLQNQGDDKAGQFLAFSMRFQSIIALVIAEHILHSIVYLSSKIPITTFLKQSNNPRPWLKCYELNDRTNRFRMSCISLHLT
jgi:hypothetical protein